MALTTVTDVKGTVSTPESNGPLDDALPNETGVRSTAAGRVAADTDRFEVMVPVARVDGSSSVPANDRLEQRVEERDGASKQTPVAGMIIANKYELRQPLGQGGMGTVWTARDLALDVDVALKLIRPELVTPLSARRLLREARTAAKLRHPGIVRTTDFGTAAHGAPFLVMELLKGESLSDRLRRVRRLEADEAVRHLLPIAHALAAAHRHAIVHRDLKPENIYLAELDSGVEPKLLDFGVAKIERPGENRLTTGGAVVGSPSYMSPEQAQGLEADARSDVWSFCVVLYEVVIGFLPFTHENHNGLLQRIIHSEPEPLCSYGLRVPGLWPIIERGLSKDPARRWPSMQALGRELAMWLLVRGVTDDITGRSLRSAWLEGDPGAADILAASDAPETEPTPVVPPPLARTPRALQRRWLRYGLMPVVMAVMGGIAGGYLRTRDSAHSSMVPVSTLRTGIARSLSACLPVHHLSAPIVVSAPTVSSQQAAAVEDDGAVRAGQTRGATHVGSATVRDSAVLPDSAREVSPVGSGSAGQRSSRGAPPAASGTKPGSELDIKTVF